MAEEQLHDQILRLAYLANTERPAHLSSEDLFWKLQDERLTLAQIKECLEWLVRRGDMDIDRSKYALSKARFFELKGQFAHLGPQGIAIWLAPIAPIRIPAPAALTVAAESLSVLAPASPTATAKSVPATETPPPAPQEIALPMPPAPVFTVTAPPLAPPALGILRLSIPPSQLMLVKFLLGLQVLLIAGTATLLIAGDNHAQRSTHLLVLATMAATSIVTVCMLQILRNSPLITASKEDEP
jgi:hypothetical protein